MRRGPGLLGTMARTAVVAGTATAVSGGVMRRQRARSQQAAEAAAYQQQQDAQVQQQYAQQTYPQPDQAASKPDMIAKLRELADLKAAGALTDEEFTAAKSQLLGS